MKLKRQFAPQQLLSILLAAAVCCQAVRAQDRIVTKDGRTQAGKVVGVTGGILNVEIGAGKIGIPLATVSQVVMPAPADFATATKAYGDRNFPLALVNAKAVSDKYKGLPAEWAQQATAMVGDIYAAMNDLPKAEAAYRDFQKFYPGAGGAQTEVGLAKVAFLKKDYASAKQKLGPIAAAALKDKSPSKTVAPIYGQAFLLLGQIDEASGDKTSALENYLRTAAIFNQDELAAGSAQQMADALRKSNPDIAVP